MLTRDTQPLPAIKENVFKKIGVIGAEPKSGATFICRLLEREKSYINEGGGGDKEISTIEIVDMGDTEVNEELDCVLIVMDCRKELSDKVLFAIKTFKRKHTRCAVVLNHWDEGFQMPDLFESETDLISFKIPSMNLKDFIDLYNFTFCS